MEVRLTYAYVENGPGVNGVCVRNPTGETKKKEGGGKEVVTA